MLCNKQSKHQPLVWPSTPIVDSHGVTVQEVLWYFLIPAAGLGLQDVCCTHLGPASKPGLFFLMMSKINNVGRHTGPLTMQAHNWHTVTCDHMSRDKGGPMTIPKCKDWGRTICPQWEHNKSVCGGIGDIHSNYR